MKKVLTIFILTGLLFFNHQVYSYSLKSISKTKTLERITIKAEVFNPLYNEAVITLSIDGKFYKIYRLSSESPNLFLSRELAFDGALTLTMIFQPPSGRKPGQVFIEKLLYNEEFEDPIKFENVPIMVWNSKGKIINP